MLHILSSYNMLAEWPIFCPFLFANENKTHNPRTTTHEYNQLIECIKRARDGDQGWWRETDDMKPSDSYLILVNNCLNFSGFLTIGSLLFSKQSFQPWPAEVDSPPGACLLPLVILIGNHWVGMCYFCQHRSTVCTSGSRELVSS